MKRKNGFKRIIAFLTAVMMLLSCMCSLSFADTETATMAGSSRLTVSSMYGGRQFELYQIFYGDLVQSAGSESRTLENIQWGASVADHEDEIMQALKASTLKDGTENIIAELFVGLDDDATAEQVASVLKTMNDNSDDLDTFAQIVSDVISGYDTTEKKVATTAGSVTNGGNHHAVFNNIHDGYYLIAPVEGEPEADTTYSKFMIKVAGPSTVNTKTNSVPTLDKEIVKYDDEGTETGTGRFANASIGDEITFRLTSKVPGMDGFTKYFFIVRDELTEGLEFKDIKSITVGNTTLSEADYTLTTYTDSDSDMENDNATSAFKLVFHNFIQYNVGDAITIEYTAVVTDEASVGKASENVNAAKLQYSNNPNFSYEGENEPNDNDKSNPDGDLGNTTWAKAYVYTTGVEILKKDTTDGTRLEGAVFKIEGKKLNTVVEYSYNYVEVDYLNHPIGTTSDKTPYYKLQDGAMTELSPSENADEDYAMEYVKYTAEGNPDVDGAYYLNTATNQYTDEYVEGGTYQQDYIVYNISGEPRRVVRTVEDNVTYEGTVGTNGELIVYGLGAGEYTITEIKAPTGYTLLNTPIKLTVEFTEPTAGSIEDGCKWSYTYMDTDGKTQSAQPGQDGILSLIVNNSKGGTLPSTGGIGTTIFYTVGSALLIGAAILLITKRRMAKEND